MGESYTEPTSLIQDMIRAVFSAIDKPAFWLLSLMYKLFFNVATADIFANDTIMKFYSRVQLILGVFMMFQLALIILKGIMNPDNFTGGKKGSGAEFIRRVAISLVLLTVLVPISIPGAKNEWEKQLNNNGLLFGSLYSLQNRILSNNTLGRLILGTSDDTSSSFTSSDSDDTIDKAARIFTSTVLKATYRINLLPDDDRPTHEDGKDDAVFNENRVCQNIDDEVLAAYTRLDAEPSEIISMVTATCEAEDVGFFQGLVGKVFPELAGTERYVLAYTPILGFVIALIFAVILLSFAVDVAIRAIKLVVLRLIAPIPIVAYMDPNGSQDEMFNSWKKTLVSTYLDLFIRLAVVYFVIFLIQDMIINGIVINTGSGVIGTFSWLLIVIGLFIFAKQAPMFLKQALGIKNDGFRLFGGLRELGAAGAVAMGGIGGAISRGSANVQNSDNFGKKLLSGITGGIAGGVGGTVNAGREYFRAKDHPNSKDIMNSARAYNMRNYTNASDDSTFGGRTLAGLQSNLGMKNKFQRYEDQLKAYDSARSAWKRIDNALNSDDGYEDSSHVKHGVFRFSGSSLTSHGETIFDNTKSYSAKEANDIVSRMKSSGRYTQSEIETAEEIKKQIHKQRFAEVAAAGRNNQFGTGDEVYAGIETLYSVGQRYDGDGVFDLGTMGSTIRDASYGGYKGAAYKSERQGEKIKASQDYARAQANANRAGEKKK